MRFLISICLLVGLALSAPRGMAEEIDITEIAEAHSAFEAAPNDGSRDALFAALQDYRGPATVETVKAYWQLMTFDVEAGDQDKLRASAIATAEHLDPVADLLPQRYIEAKYIAAVAYFSDQLAQDAMLEMAHVKGFTTQYLDETGERPDWAEKLRWRADAWGMAMQAYFESAGERYPAEGEIDAILASYGYNEASLNAAAIESPGESSGLPHCRGSLVQRPRLRYPAGGARKGMYGAVILQLEFDQDGNVVNPTVLASVPVEQFEEKSLRTVGKWRYKADKPNAVGNTCALERTNVIQPLVFQLR
ncbi:MAG: energy transducer TonB [Hyphomonadaceae bacterium]|nr:energy transducer TonB [Hyphomonadaceae bacterium]